MSLRFSLDATQVEKKIDSMTKGLKDFREPLDNAGGDLLKFFGDTVFQSQGAEAGATWKRLAQSTLYARAHRIGYYANTPITLGKILIWTGRLMRGFEKAVTKTTLIIRNGVDYFKYHQLSQRKMLTINSKVITIVVGHIRTYADKLVSK